MKKVILNILVLLSPTSFYAEDYFQWIKNNCSEVVLWRCFGFFCLSCIAADKIFPYAKKKIEILRGIHHETVEDVFNQKMKAQKRALERKFTGKLAELEAQCELLNKIVIQNHAHATQSLQDTLEKIALNATHDQLTLQKNELMLEIEAIKKIIDERAVEKKLSLEKAQEIVLQRREKVVKEFREDTYSKKEIELYIKEVKKECLGKTKKILEKTKVLVERHECFVKANTDLMKEILDLKKEYDETKKLVDIFACESNALTFQLYRLQARAKNCENVIAGLEEKQASSIPQNKKFHKKKRNSWSDDSDSNPNTPRLTNPFQNHEIVDISPRDPKNKADFQGSLEEK